MVGYIGFGHVGGKIGKVASGGCNIEMATHKIENVTGMAFG